MHHHRGYRPNPTPRLRPHVTMISPVPWCTHERVIDGVNLPLSIRPVKPDGSTWRLLVAHQAITTPELGHGLWYVIMSNL